MAFSQEPCLTIETTVDVELIEHLSRSTPWRSQSAKLVRLPPASPGRQEWKKGVERLGVIHSLWLILTHGERTKKAKTDRSCAHARCWGILRRRTALDMTCKVANGGGWPVAPATILARSPARFIYCRTTKKRSTSRRGRSERLQGWKNKVGKKGFSVVGAD